MRRVTGLGLGLLALSACVAPRQPAPPPPPPPPAPRPAPPPAPAPAPADWRERSVSPGDWNYAAGTARYGALAIRCDRGANQVRFGWVGVASGPVTVRTTYGDTARPAQPGPEGLMLVLAARDPLLDQIAFSRGRFMLEAAGQALILPAWPELVRVVEECR